MSTVPDPSMPSGDPQPRTAPGAPPVVALEHVHKRYGDVAAVADVSLAISRGELFALLGPSGCGKTTLLRLIAGFETPDGGRVRLDGADVSAVPPHRRPVNTVFQQYALFPHLSVFDNVAFGPRARRLPRAEIDARVRRLLALVRLEDFAARRPDQLSGGQRQRVALARALVNFPRALLLDEPLSALDPTLRETMQRELARIQREVGIAFVLVTHDQQEALALADRIAVMHDGRIEQVGTPEAIYHAPATVFVAGFIGRANLLPVTVEAIDGAQATVRLAGGQRVPVPTGAQRVAPGSAAILMLRPERLALAAHPPDAPAAALPVTVTDILFQGSVLRCRLRDGSGAELVAELDDARRPPGLTRGAALLATWDPAAARLILPSG